jgi:hypothetical protein
MMMNNTNGLGDEGEVFYLIGWAMRCFLIFSDVAFNLKDGKYLKNEKLESFIRKKISKRENFIQ